MNHSKRAKGDPSSSTPTFIVDWMSDLLLRATPLSQNSTFHTVLMPSFPLFYTASSRHHFLFSTPAHANMILSRLHRSKDHKFKWEFEGDMLADFGKDPELCMKAVCALYRQQTAEEKRNKETLHYNGRGFSKFDAPRGSKLAEFLIDGDPSGDLKKSVLELQAYNSKGVKLCRKLATHYSKQLFQIYKNKEDPLFLPHDQASQ
ncbi:hypothetical protein OIU76_022929 [Salix suchowensis]|nr:hypothetical protein OIU76_022929 [Salix suchowensis]